MASTDSLPHPKHWGATVLRLGCRALQAICIWTRTGNFAWDQRESSIPSPIPLHAATRDHDVDYQVVPFLDPSPAVDSAVAASKVTARHLLEGY